MKTLISILVLGIATATFIAGMFFGRYKPIAQSPQRLTLEQIVSIKELHLVRHTYTDLFFIHKNNKKEKAIRAIVEVPVEITAYINLKATQVITRGDSITQLVLPKAVLNKPAYALDRMVIRETRSFQLHAGKDLYPTVAQYVQAALLERMVQVSQASIERNIKVQAEAEAKEYVEACLRAIGREDIIVTFADAQTNKQIAQYTQHARL